MKKTILCTAILALLNTTGFAENNLSSSATSTASPSVGATTPDSKTPPTPSTDNKSTPNSTPPTIPATPTTPTAPATQDTQQQKLIDCNYHIPTQTTTIDETLIKSWAEKAAVQSFDFNPTAIDQELIVLKSCYTDQGWQGFSDALEKSGNVNAIKTQHLTVSSQVDGDLTYATSKENQWKVTVPLQVVYQNEKEKLTQLLSVDLLIGRKMSGDLGIVQMVASPRTEAIKSDVQATQQTPSTNVSATPTPPVATSTTAPTLPIDASSKTPTSTPAVPAPTPTSPTKNSTEGVSPGASTTGTSTGSSTPPAPQKTGQ